MSTNNYMQYDNQKKSKTTAYLLGAISWIIPLGLHKFYLGDTEWGVAYVLMSLIYINLWGTPLGMICLYASSILMLVDAIKTSIDVDKHNDKLIFSLKGNDE